MRVLAKILFAAVVLFGTRHVYGFSLLGPDAFWMDNRLGYRLNTPVLPAGGGGSGVGGPMNLGEEYRWNIPTVTYGFTAAFLNYFGQRGVTEIEKAINIINDLPSMDAINIDDYPLSSQRVNHQAQALFLEDVKSVTLSF